MATADQGSSDGGVTTQDVKEDVEKVRYKCTLCGETFDSTRAVRFHINQTGSGPHRGRDANEDPHLIEVVGSEVLARINEREDGGEMVDDTTFKIMWTIYMNPDASQEEVADMLDLSTGHVGNVTTRAGVMWTDRHDAVEEWLSERMPNLDMVSHVSDEDAARDDGEDQPVLEDRQGEDGDTEQISASRGMATYTGPETGIDTTDSDVGNTAEKAAEVRASVAENAFAEPEETVEGDDEGYESLDDLRMGAADVDEKAQVGSGEQGDGEPVAVLDADTAFEVIRQTSRGTARDVFDSIVGDGR
jgi:hypothetical protein